MSEYQIMPVLDHATEDALKSSIDRYGVLLPVVVDLEGNILDGHHRVRIADELNRAYPITVVIPEPAGKDDHSAEAEEFKEAVWRQVVAATINFRGQGKITVVTVPPDASPEDIAKTLNLDRRHLGVEDRRGVVAGLRQQGHSLRAIAGAVGVSEAQIRKDITAEELRSGTQLAPEKIIGIDGKSRPSTVMGADSAAGRPVHWSEKVRLRRRGSLGATPELVTLATALAIIEAIEVPGGMVLIVSDEDREPVVADLRKARTDLTRMINAINASRLDGGQFE